MYRIDVMPSFIIRAVFPDKYFVRNASHRKRAAPGHGLPSTDLTSSRSRFRSCADEAAAPPVRERTEPRVGGRGPAPGRVRLERDGSPAEP